MCCPGPSGIAHSDHSGLCPRLDRDKAVVVLCQKGLKLGQGVAARLRADGFRAEYLSGGMYGWRDQPNALRIPMAALPPQVDGTSLWVTRHRPRVDRIACPWLLRRFVDARVQVLFVAPDAVIGVADRFGAIPFDVPGAEWSHRGDQCTFDTMLDRFELHCPALDTMARVIRAADTGAHDLAPQAAGLLALSVGLSRQYRDDLALLEAGMTLYDA